MFAGQYHKREIGPGRLSRHPAGQRVEVFPEEAFFGDEYRVGIALRGQHTQAVQQRAARAEIVDWFKNAGTAMKDTQ